MSTIQKAGLILTALLLPSLGCTLTDSERRDWSGYTGPGASHFQEPELGDGYFLADPAEPWNRFSGGFNHVFLIGFVDPLSTGYRFLVPAPARKAIGRLRDNLAWPKRFVNDLLQGEFADAGTETARFLINTTIGIVGLFDVADAFGIEADDEDTAETFEQWGWEADTFLVLPILGPGSDRDTPASVLDMALDPASYVPGLSQVLKFNDGSDEMEKYKRFVRSNYDPYAFSRFLWDLNSRSHFRDFTYSDETSAEAQTLQAAFLKFKDSDFVDDCDEDEVEIPSTGEDLEFMYIMRDEPAPILYILPGLGAHRESDSSLGLMEMAYNHGFSAVAISSAMNFDFMETAGSEALPGFGPVDAHDVHLALDRIHKQLQEEYPGRIKQAALMGLSLGGYHALEIAAAAEKPGNKLVRFDRYVSVNPPVSLFNAMAELDRFFNAPLEWPEAERDRRIKITIMKVLKLMDGEGPEAMEVPVSSIEARFLIGLTYRLALMFAIHDSQSRQDLGVLATSLSGVSRGPAYSEIIEYSYMEYFYAFVLPYFVKHRSDVKGEQDMIALSDLRHIEKELRATDKVRLFTNSNDFLLSDDDVRWINSVFDQKYVKFFPSGGHLGNLWRKEIQEELMLSLKDLKRKL
ncbi:MAG: MlaA family lipoprotein [Planctomycetota bacterium]